MRCTDSKMIQMKYIIKTKSLLTLSFLVCSILLMSCGGNKKNFDSEKGIDITESDNIQHLDSMIMEFVKPDMEVIELNFEASDNDNLFSIGKGKAILFYVDPANNKKRRGLVIDLKTGTASEDTTYNSTESKKKYKGHKLTRINCCSMIANNVNEAIDILDLENISVDGIGTYTIDMHNKPDKVKHYFTLRKRTGEVERRTYYDEYRFEADGKGKVKKLK